MTKRKTALIVQPTHDERIFVNHFLEKGGDLEAVAKEWPLAWPLTRCRAYYALDHVKALCNQRFELEAEKAAEMRVMASKLDDPAFIRAHAVENIVMAAPGGDKTKALEFGATLSGMIGKEKKQEQPESPIYRALTTTRRIIAEEITTQEVAEPKALPAVIVVDDDVIDL